MVIFKSLLEIGSGPGHLIHYAHISILWNLLMMEMNLWVRWDLMHPKNHLKELKKQLEHLPHLQKSGTTYRTLFMANTFNILLGKIEKERVLKTN